MFHHWLKTPSADKRSTSPFINLISRDLDGSGNRNNGVEFGGVNYVPGKIGQAASFDGIDGWIDIPDLTFAGDFTIEAWVKLNDTIK